MRRFNTRHAVCILAALAACCSVLFGAPPGALAQVRADRLERLADHLDQRVPPAKFNIMYWGTTDDPDAPNYVGCSLGHAVAVFRPDGLRYGHADPFGFPVITYRGLANFEAAREFFAVSDADARFLFLGAGEAGTDPHRAARNLRSVARGLYGPPAPSAMPGGLAAFTPLRE